MKGTDSKPQLNVVVAQALQPPGDSHGRDLDDDHDGAAAEVLGQHLLGTEKQVSAAKKTHSDSTNPMEGKIGFDADVGVVEPDRPDGVVKRGRAGGAAVLRPGAFQIYPGDQPPPAADHDIMDFIATESDIPPPLQPTQPPQPPQPTVVVHGAELYNEEDDYLWRLQAIQEAREAGHLEGLEELALNAVKAVPIEVKWGPEADASCPRRYATFRIMLAIGLVVVVAVAVVVTVTVAVHQKTTASPSLSPTHEAQCFENRSVLLDAIDAYLKSPDDHNYSYTYGLSITSWCVSAIQSFDFLFSSDRNPAADHFDADLSGWDISNATSMVGMFLNARRFTGVGLESWNVSSATNMSSMFEGAWSFDANLSDWDVVRVTMMHNMFSDASQFRGVGLDLWNVARVQDVSGMFNQASLMDADFSRWNVSQVETMHAMFANASSFRGLGLQRWNVSRVNDMAGMFFGAFSFSANLSTWDVSHVKNMSSMFGGATDFDGTGLDQWDVSQVVDMGGLFWDAFALDVSLSSWDVSRVVDMEGMLLGASLFESNLSRWDVSRVTVMRNMFYGAYNFSGMGLDKWETSRVQDMYQMFYNAMAFDVDLSAWNVSQVTTMAAMFLNATQFKGTGLETWNVSRVQSLSSMFFGASLFDGNLSCWDVSQATDLVSMFFGATSFRGIGGLGNWNVSRVTQMFNVFRNASNFIGADLGKWDVSNVQNMYKMFWGASSFNGNLSGWNVSNVGGFQGMRLMFSGAVSFQGEGLESWNPMQTVDMSEMFYGASVFNANLCGWGQRLRLDVNTTSMFIGTLCPLTESPNLNLTTPGPFCYECK